MKNYTDKNTAPLKFHSFLRFVMPIGIIIGIINSLDTYAGLLPYWPYANAVLKSVLMFELLALLADIALRCGFIFGAGKWRPYAYRCIVTLVYYSPAYVLVDWMLISLCGLETDPIENIISIMNNISFLSIY